MQYGGLGGVQREGGRLSVTPCVYEDMIGLIIASNAAVWKGYD
jgi:hypothetical protein